MIKIKSKNLKLFLRGGKVTKKEDKKAPVKKVVKEVEEIKREPTPIEIEG